MNDQTQQQSEQGRLESQSLSEKPHQPPTEVSGYDIQRFLGAGAFGEVWVGVDRNTGRKVAIKFYTGRSRVDIALLSREVEKLVFLSTDRYVVQLLDVGWDAQPPYYVMDFIEQGSLEDFLQAAGPLGIADTVELSQEIATGLSHLHNRGVLHCDLKPANVLLDDDRKPRLADFGQARLSSEKDPALGTLFYMAPEQADLEAIPDTRWDVYSLGAIMYCMLVGSPPYRDDLALSEVGSGTSITERLSRYRQIIERQPTPVAHREVAGIDRHLIDIIDRCLEVDPAQRFDSAQSVLVALEQREEAMARRPLMLLGFVAPLALLLVTAVFSWGLYHKSVNETDESLKQKAQESNGWAAQFAARSAADRIDDFFAAVEGLAQDASLVEQLTRLQQDPEFTALLQGLDHPSLNDSPDADVVSARQQLTDFAQRQTLQDWTDHLMQRPDLPQVASWFVCDRRGVQVAASFARDDFQNTVGKCFAYRTYFSGAPQDLTTVEDGSVRFQVSGPDEPRAHINGSHLSAIFASQATGTWKIAFSTPIEIDGRFLGVLAATADMGEFVEFDDQASQFVMLVDGREGPNRGAILEHPLFDQYRSAGELLPVECRRVRLPESLLKEELGELIDPLAQFDPNRNDSQLWLSANRPVRRKQDPLLQRDESKRIPTGLMVLALEDADAVVEPAHQLSNAFIRWGLLAFSLLIAIMLVVWTLVIRLLKGSTARLNRVLVTHRSEHVGDQPVSTAAQPADATHGH